VVRALGLTDSAIGLTLLALATTAELFALAWAAMRRGVSEIAAAGVIGSVAPTMPQPRWGWPRSSGH
jgi:cation:H+ antiporter